MKKIQIKVLLLSVIIISGMILLSGCYTQIGTIKEESDQNTQYEEGYYNKETYTDSLGNEVNNYYYHDYPRYRNYGFRYYYPYRFSFGFYDPWWDYDSYWGYSWGYNPYWWGYYPTVYYSPYYYNPLYNPWGYYGYYGYYDDPYYYHRSSDTRNFGSTRGTSRTSGSTRIGSGQPTTGTTGVRTDNSRTGNRTEGTRTGEGTRIQKSSPPQQDKSSNRGSDRNSGANRGSEKRSSSGDSRRSSGQSRGNRVELIPNTSKTPQTEMKPLTRDNAPNRTLTPIPIPSNPSSRIGRTSGTGFNNSKSNSNNSPSYSPTSSSGSDRGSSYSSPSRGSSSSTGNSGSRSSGSSSSGSSSSGSRSSGSSRGNR